jgi:hypothetical protein
MRGAVAVGHGANTEAGAAPGGPRHRPGKLHADKGTTTGCRPKACDSSVPNR